MAQFLNKIKNRLLVKEYLSINFYDRYLAR